MMTRRKRLAVLGLLILLLILVLLLLWRFLRPVPEAAPTEPDLSLKPDEILTDTPTLAEQQLKEEQDTRAQTAGATTVAKMFVERYGSYSNEAEFQNLRDVLPLMTDTFAEKTRAFIEGAEIPETFYGVTTRVLIVQVERMDETAGEATFKINTQQERAEGSAQNVSVHYQEIRVELKREAGVWKVSSAAWL